MTVGTNIAISATNVISTSVISSQWTTAGTVIHYNTGRVGIGITNPGFSLHVVGDINATTMYRVNGNQVAVANISGLQGALDLKQNTLTPGTNITISGTTISASGGTSQWTTSGTTIHYNGGNVGINTTDPRGRLQVNGTMVVNGGVNYAHTKNCMQTGSLTIGSTDKNNGFGNLWTTNTAGLLLECLDSTEIAVHDAGQRVLGLLSYSGNTTNTLTIGRDMGWGGPSSTALNANLQIPNQLQMTGAEPTITFRDTDHRTAFIHVNSNLMYFLTGGVNVGYGSWAQVANSRWPLTLNLTDNQARFGGKVNCMSLTVVGLVSLQTDVWHTSTDTKQRIYYQSNSTTYYRGHEATAHTWRNATDGTIMELEDTALKRWYAEDWKDVNPDKKKGSYPVYRPTKRVSKKTSLTANEIDPADLKAKSKKKQQIKGKSNLKPFVKKSH